MMVSKGFLNHLGSKNLGPESIGIPSLKGTNISLSLLWPQSLNLKSKQLYC